MTRQPELRTRLGNALARIKQQIDGAAALRSNDEQLDLHLWLHSAATQSLTLVAQSDRQIFNPATLQAARLALPSSYLVVEALCNGTVVEATDPALASGRWGSMLAVPFTATQEVAEAGCEAALPAGVIVLASTKLATAGVARFRDRPVARRDLVAALGEFASRLVVTVLTEVGDHNIEVDLIPIRGSRRDRGGEQRSSGARVGAGTYISGSPPETPLDESVWSDVLRAADEELTSTTRG